MRKPIVGSALVLAALVLGGTGGSSPAARVELILAAPVDAGFQRRAADAVEQGVADAVRRLGAERVARMLSAVPGGALADEPERRVLKAVEVQAVAPDRVRITVGAQDMLAGHTVAESVASSLAASGLRERLRLSSETRGSGMSIVAWGVLGLSLLLLLGKGVSAAIARSNGSARR